MFYILLATLTFVYTIYRARQMTVRNNAIQRQQLMWGFLPLVRQATREVNVVAAFSQRLQRVQSQR